MRAAIAAMNTRRLLAASLLLLAACGGRETASRQIVRDSILETGFAGPENLVYDSAADVLLIANINGDPMQKDGNGFITRIAASGNVESLKWIDGSQAATRLDAPKGLVLRGDTLFVADVDVIRAFDRRDGRWLANLPVAGSKMLNDVVFGSDGVLYATDTQANAIYARTPEGWRELARGDDLEKPDGIESDGADMVVAPLGGNELYRVSASGARAKWITLATGKLDGLHRLADGSYLVTSWQGKNVYHVFNADSVTDIVDDIESPAGVAIIPGSRIVFITSLNGNRIYRVSLAGVEAAPD